MHGGNDVMLVWLTYMCTILNYKNFMDVALPYEPYTGLVKFIEILVLQKCKVPFYDVFNIKNTFNLTLMIH